MHWPRPRLACEPVSLLRRWFGTSSGHDLLVLHPRSRPQHQLDEALRLAESLTGTPCPHLLAGPSRNFRPHPATFFGRGAVDAIAAACAAAPPRRVFVNAQLTGVQQRTLELALHRSVLDRVALIIEIFSQRARTKEARLQVELAQLDYLRSRLVRVADPSTGKRRGFGAGGEVEVVSARERGRSGSGGGGLGGAGGGGESELQLQGRRLVRRRAALLRALTEVRRTREVQRAARRRAGLPLVALVGYTNAGKSSLMGALTGGGVQGEDRLFATLDPTMRRLSLPSGGSALMADTVGFVSHLPHQLIDAFSATLEEVLQADLLLHVVDGSSPRVEEEKEVVLGVLRGLGVPSDRLQHGLIEVLNKTDLVTGAVGAQGVKEEGLVGGGGLDTEPAAEQHERGLDAEGARGEGDRQAATHAAEGRDAGVRQVAVSAVTGEGLPQLLQGIEAGLQAIQQKLRAGQ